MLEVFDARMTTCGYRHTVEEELLLLFVVMCAVILQLHLGQASFGHLEVEQEGFILFLGNAHQLMPCHDFDADDFAVFTKQSMMLCESCDCGNTHWSSCVTKGTPFSSNHSKA